MGLFTDPLVLTDGTDSHTFNFRGQLPDNSGRSLIGDYVEPAAGVAADSKLTIKHDLRSKTPRHLASRQINKRPAANTDDATLLPITINYTIVASNDFSDAELALEHNITIDALQEAGFLPNMRLKML